MIGIFICASGSFSPFPNGVLPPGQAGEECFELKVYSGKELLTDESFVEIDPLLARATELRMQYAHA
jgi:hypothetical protein